MLVITMLSHAKIGGIQCGQKRHAQAFQTGKRLMTVQLCSKQLKQATTKPVIASVLNALSDFDIKTGAEFSSILTFDSDRLCDVHFPPPYRASDFRIVGLRPENPLRMRIEGDISGNFDLGDMTANVMDDFKAALTPSTQTVILECTNLPAYKPQMRTITKVRFVDILAAIELIAPNTIAPCFL